MPATPGSTGAPTHLAWRQALGEALSSAGGRYPKETSLPSINKAGVRPSRRLNGWTRTFRSKGPRIGGQGATDECCASLRVLQTVAGSRRWMSDLAMAGAP